MSLRGPIILIEDDQNDTEVIIDGLKAIKVENQVLNFFTAEDAYQYLLATREKPFFILCDIKMPQLDGLTFRKRICSNPFLKKKSIPFIFLTAFASQDIVNSAYDLDVQGFYQKESSFERLKEQLLMICLYWKGSLHPNREIE